jgi:hypothetical protein
MNPFPGLLKKIRAGENIPENKEFRDIFQINCHNSAVYNCHTVIYSLPLFFKGRVRDELKVL